MLSFKQAAIFDRPFLFKEMKFKNKEDDSND